MIDERFDEVWASDFEFTAAPGENPRPICAVFRNLKTGEERRSWFADDGLSPPVVFGQQSLFVAYYASAEIGCFLELGWAVPPHILDLFTEFRCLTNGLAPPDGASLIGALRHFGLEWTGAAEKESMRSLAIRGGPFTCDEKTALLDYCAADVVGCEQLYAAMQDRIDLPRARLRGRYMAAVAKMERIGIPINATQATMLREAWDEVRDRVTEEVDREYAVYEDGVFRTCRFEELLTRHGVFDWPRSKQGRLVLDDETFAFMVQRCPALQALRDLRRFRSEMRTFDLPIGHDGRNRTMLSAFRSITGRNQPSNTRFAFGLPSWLRGLIEPSDGFALAYIDYSQQEFAIAGALSRDVAMMDAYRSGDPYLSFAKKALAVPADATKDSHPEERAIFKQCILAVQYGMGEESLAVRIGRPVAYATELLRSHRLAFPRYWEWSERVVDHGRLMGAIHTVFGWSLRCAANTKPRTVANFPMQANGAEILRIACIRALDAGVRVCAPIHDALLIEAHVEDIDDAIATTQSAMCEAAQIVLDGFEVRTDVRKIIAPATLLEKRGEVMWNRVNAAARVVHQSTRRGAMVPTCSISL